MMDFEAELGALRQRADNLLERANLLKTSGENIAGVGKVKKKIQAELTFIKSLQDGKVMPKENQLKSTNLSHLEALLYTAESFGHVTALLKPIQYETDMGCTTTLVVDVIGHNGRSWVKVTARKAEALHRIWEGEGEYGEHDIMQQAMQYIDACEQHPVDFSPPAVHVVFFSGITQAVADELLEEGVVVHGHIFKDEDETREVKPAIPAFQPEEVIVGNLPETSFKEVNLDVTTMIALISDLCHGGSCYTFNEPLIEELAEQERHRPLLPQLEKFLNGKKLVASGTAVTDFKAIVKTIAGEREKQRADELLARLTVVPDQPSPRTLNLSPSNKIKERAKVIFGTGDSLRIVTSTANEAFIRATSKQGVDYTVYIHQSRALTEKKQSNPARAMMCQTTSSNTASGLDNSEYSSSADQSNALIDAKDGISSESSTSSGLNCQLSSLFNATE